jgi:hypothetical protein
MNEAKELTEREIDALVTAQVDDPEAWEEAIHVRPRRTRIHPSRMKLAARFFVLSVLNRLGADAAVMVGQRDDVDIAVIGKNGQTITVEVKVVVGSTRWHVERVRERPGHFLVFVCFVGDVHDPEAAPEVYIVASEQLAGHLAQSASLELVLAELGQELRAPEAWHRLLAPATAA